MEANHNADIRAALSQTCNVMERSIVATMARLGAANPYAAGLALTACARASACTASPATKPPTPAHSSRWSSMPPSLER